MNRVEVSKLLTRASAIDNRIVTEETVAAWWELLGMVEYDLAVEAVNEHFRKSTDYLLPAHIIQGARIARDRRERDERRDRALMPRPVEKIMPPPTCIHGKTIATCMPCARELPAT